MRNMFLRFRRNRSGSVLIEYITIASLISVAFISVATSLGNTISDDFVVIGDIFRGPPKLQNPS